jgi:hypothetical protein
MNAFPTSSFLPVSLTEILGEIPKLSFAERQELVRRALELEDQDVTAEEKVILSQRIEDFRPEPKFRNFRRTTER